MTTLVMSGHKKRLRLITPVPPAEGKVLKLCVRCRQHKTKCDAIYTKPNPCSHCLKKNINCTLDIITHAPKRAFDVVEKLANEVHTLKSTLNRVIEKKAHMIQLLMERGREIQRINAQVMVPLPDASTPSVSEIQSCLNLPDEAPVPSKLSVVPTMASASHFTIQSNLAIAPVSLTISQALHHFDNYHIHFHRFLPILPDLFFEDLNVGAIHRENDLLFWSIVVTSSLNGTDPAFYSTLAHHIKNLVVSTCWLSTPRSFYTLASLLILTTWPLPMESSDKIHDNLSVRYISLMKNLALQLGLHKLEFINEFSHKTKVNMASEAELNNVIRERIYKFININSNYWLVFLGLSNTNYNGLSQDYITNKAANVDLFNNDHFASEDNFINSLLKISLIQSKMNENMNDLIEHPNHISKLINLNMFEIIIDDFSNFEKKNRLFDNSLIKLSLEFTRLQLYTYAFSASDLTIEEYRTTVLKSIKSCDTILLLFKQEFSHLSNFNQLPIHYRFIIEMVMLVLMRIHSSPVLTSVDHYHHVKALFNSAYTLFTTNTNPKWNTLNSKLLKMMTKFNAVSTLDIMALQPTSFALVTRMKNYLVCSLHYELIYFIYHTSKNPVERSAVNWDVYGLHRDYDADVMDYILASPSIFTSLHQ